MSSSSMVERIGWTLLHSTWQLLAIGLAFAVMHFALRGRAATVRYAVGCIALLLMSAAPIVTYTLLPGSPAAVTTASAQPPAEAEGNAEWPIEPTTRDESALLDSTALDSGLQPRPADFPLIDAVAPTWQERALQTIQRLLPMLVAIWALGVSLLSLRPMCGLYWSRHLGRTGLSDASDTVTALLHCASSRLGITQTVRIAQSALVQVPSVVGYFRPIILLPGTALTGLTTEQLEAVIVHELAHVRRHDQLVNFLQTIVETLLFYHPAVWWVSSQVRHAREHCCDDLAMAALGNRVGYARTLVTLDELRGQGTSAALAANGGSLLHRIRRIAGRDDVPRRAKSWLAGLVLLATLSIFVGASLLNSALAQSNDDAASTATSKDGRLRAELKHGRDEYLLGQSIVLRFVVTNISDQPVKISEGGDYRGAPRPLRFQVIATDANGRPVDDPYPMPNSHGGLSVAPSLAPGKSRELTLPLLRYCDFRRAGSYKVRVYHDLGLDQQQSSFPTAPTAPIAETTINIVMPSQRQATRLVGHMVTRRRKQGVNTGWGRNEVDFAALRHPIYLPALQPLLEEKFSGLHPGLVGISNIATPEATAMLVDLVEYSTSPLAPDALRHLLDRLPHPDAERQRTKSGRWARIDRFAKRSWSGEHRQRMLQIASSLVASGRYFSIDGDKHANMLSGARIYQALGRRADYQKFMSAMSGAIHSLYFSPDKPETYTNAVPVYHALAEAGWIMLCDRATKPPRDLTATLDQCGGRLDLFTFLRLMSDRKDYRPDRWEERVDRLLHESNPVVRSYTMQHLPSPVTREWARWIEFNMTDHWGNWPEVNLVALRLAEQSKSAFFLAAINKSLEQTKDPRVQAAAKRALAACSKPTVKVPTRNELGLPPEVPYDRIDQLVTQIKRNEDRERAIDELRKLSTLDFGSGEDELSRRLWHNWRARERSNRRSAFEERRIYCVYGRVTDPDGEPIVDAMVNAFIGYNLLARGGPRSGYSLTDKNGRYVLQFGYHRNYPPKHIRAAGANITVSQSGYFVPAEEFPGQRIVTEVKLGDDPLLDVDEDQAIYPGQPVEINYVMHPAVRLRLDVVDADGQPIVPEGVDIGRKSKTTGEYQTRWLVKRRDGSFSNSALHSGYDRNFIIKVDNNKDNNITSDFVPLLEPGDYRLRLTVQGKEQPRVKVEVVAAPGKAAAKTEDEASADDKPGEPAADSNDADKTTKRIPVEDEKAGKEPATTGRLRGRFVFDGTPPEPPKILLPRERGLDLHLESLVVGQEGGIANIFVWVRSADIPVPAEAELFPKAKLTIKGGRYEPHAMAIHSSQKLVLANHDKFGVNALVQAMKTPINVLLKPGQDFEQQFKEERLPMRVLSSIQPWMSSYVLVRDNWYFDVTGQDGRFEITDLPPGKWEFQVWHEKGGYVRRDVWPRGRFIVEIKPGIHDVGTIKLTHAQLDPKLQTSTRWDGDLDKLIANLDKEAHRINQLDPDGFSPLHRAVMGGQIALAKTLLEQGARVTVRQKQYEGMPLQYAAEQGSVEMVQLLLSHDASVDSTDRFKRTPLMWAAMRGHAGVARLLIEHGADVNARMINDSTALHLATKSGHKEVIKLLKEHGADATIRNTQGKRPADLSDNTVEARLGP